MEKKFKIIIISSILVSILFGGVSGFIAGGAYSYSDIWQTIKSGNISEINSNNVEQVIKVVSEESAIIDAVDKVSPAVVSIIITKNLPIIERYYTVPNPGKDLFGYNVPQYMYRQQGTEETEIGGGSGFIISADGYVVTNRHVVYDEEATYTVLLNDESKYETEVLARDSLTDMAILKIKLEGGEKREFPYVTLGDSSNLKPGQSVIAIGNALGEFRNTVSTGVISGLSRSVVASGGNFGRELLMGVIQTDASINLGNSGGPLLNLAGEVIGVNTAMAEGAQNIGFAIPVNEIKNSIESVRKHGRIIRPWLGVRYVMLNADIASQNSLNISEGALIVRGEQITDLAVVPGSPADKAGLVENDVILEINSVKITADNPLVKEINRYKPGDEITLKIIHKGEEKNINAKLDEMK